MTNGIITRLDSAVVERSIPERILVVEDENSVRAIVRIVLEKNGFTVFDACSAEGAIALGNGPIDLLITDVILPDMNGSQVVDALRRRHPHLKVVVMSGQHPDTVLRKTFSAWDAFLQKPFTPRMLTEMVRKVLASKG